MNDLQAEQNLVIRYLLRDLPEAEGERIGERSVVDSEYAEFVEGVELELIELYVRGKLDRTQRDLFEQNFLVTRDRREKLVALAALVSTQSKGELRESGVGDSDSKSLAQIWVRRLLPPVVKRPVIAAAAALLLIAFFVTEVSLIRQWYRTRGTPLVAMGTMPPKLRVLSGRGAGESIELLVRRDLGYVTIALAVSDTNTEYIVEVQQKGVALWRQERTQPASLDGTAVITALIPVSILADGQEYIIAWQNAKSIADTEPNTARYRIKSAP
jgi:hypothetical protein